jgi:membrane associated rhomboid family serine protease
MHISEIEIGLYLLIAIISISLVAYGLTPFITGEIYIPGRRTGGFTAYGEQAKSLGLSLILFGVYVALIVPKHMSRKNIRKFVILFQKIIVIIALIIFFGSFALIS